MQQILIRDTKKERFPFSATRLALAAVIVPLLLSSFQFDDDDDRKGKVHAQMTDSDGNGEDLPIDMDARQFPPLRALTNNGAYTVELDWQPESAGIGHETVYLVKFFDETGGPLGTPSIISYNFAISAIDGSLVEGFYGQETEDDGIGRPLVVEFENGGPIAITLNIDSVRDPSSGNRIPIDESVTFNMTVVPEFSVSVLLLVLALVMGSVLLLGRTQLHLTT